MERLTENYFGCNQIKGCSNGTCEEICKEVLDCGVCPISKAIHKLAEYEQAEEQGLLIRVPCKVGDELWWFDAFGELQTSKVNSMFVEFGIDGIVIETLICNVYANDIGKTVFLTKAEAEQALAKMKGE